jgi:hypothetical protein
VDLAVATGVPPREWLRDPVAMITAAGIIEEMKEKRG